MARRLQTDVRWKNEMLATVDLPQHNYSRLAGLGSAVNIHV